MSIMTVTKFNSGRKMCIHFAHIKCVEESTIECDKTGEIVDCTLITLDLNRASEGWVKVKETYDEIYSKYEEFRRVNILC